MRECVCACVRVCVCACVCVCDARYEGGVCASGVLHIHITYWKPQYIFGIYIICIFCFIKNVTTLLLYRLTNASEGFPGGSDGKESVCHGGDLGSIPELGQSPGEGNGNPLQYCLENSLDRGTW